MNEKPEKKNEHAGHRARMKQRFLEHGLDNFSDHNVLELLLFFAVPRRDTNRMAHQLLDAFGSLDGVFDAAPDALKKAADGMTESAVTLIRLVPAAARRYFMAKTDPGVVLTSSEAIGRYLLPRFFGGRDETAYMLSMDAKMKVLDCRELGRGSTMSVRLDVRQIVRIALEQNASVVVLAHNHASGFAVPSEEDVSATIHIRSVLANVGVLLTDHIVVAGDDFVSMADSGCLPPL